ncbi:PREDICTED: uncharacterized protein LOC109212502 [Nicotiana attenuata]|uniref:uncharacterized protein LOC109212502 n=1 Tax=Nicotiana attenuata TaxID=49451 RepID=UPI000904BA38|nr:PREDICTED: uncharacterized protein LOC109212502 [Nicotiana attenuata]
MASNTIVGALFQEVTSQVRRVIKKKNLPIPPKIDEDGEIIVSSDPLDLDEYTEEQAVVIQDIDKMSYDELRGDLIAFEKTHLDRKVQQEKRQAVAFKATVAESENEEEEEEKGGEQDENIIMLSKVKKKSFGAWSDEEESDHKKIANMFFMAIKEDSGELSLMADEGSSEVRLPTCPNCNELQEFIDIADIEKVLNEPRKIQRENKDWALKLEISQLLVISHLKQEIALHALIVATLRTVAGLEIEEKKSLKISITLPAFIVENLAIHLTIAENLDKFDPKSDEDIFPGYSPSSRAYRVFNKCTLSVEEAIHVVFVDTNPRSRNEKLPEDEEIFIVPKSFNTEPVSVVPNEWKSEPGYPHKYIIGNSQEGMKTRRSLKQTSNIALISQFEPKKVDEVLGNERWITTMKEELDQFEKNKVWELIPKPPNASIVGTKWVYRNKLNERGQVVRNKAGLVAQGYLQQKGIDYEKTFAPVAKLVSIRILLSYADHKCFRLFQMDVKNVFLNGFISEEVFVKKPPGFVNEFFPNHVYKLSKFLYGLKQALELCMKG